MRSMLDSIHTTLNSLRAWMGLFGAWWHVNFGGEDDVDETDEEWLNRQW